MKVTTMKIHYLLTVAALAVTTPHLPADRPRYLMGVGQPVDIMAAVAAGIDRELPVEQRRFLYMPYMHSESPSVHEQAMTLFATPGLEQSLGFERRHKAVIDRFGRYPHRNAVLGRESTPAEIEFMKQPGSSF